MKNPKAVSGSLLIVVGIAVLALDIYLVALLSLDSQGGNAWVFLGVLGLASIAGGGYTIRQGARQGQYVDRGTALAGTSVAQQQSRLHGLSESLGITGVMSFVIKDTSGHPGRGAGAGALIVSGGVALMPVVAGYKPVTSDYDVMEASSKVLFTFVAARGESAGVPAWEAVPTHIGYPEVYLRMPDGTIPAALFVAFNPEKKASVHRLLDTAGVALMSVSTIYGAIRSDIVEAGWDGAEPFLKSKSAEITENLVIVDPAGQPVAKVRTRQFAMHDTYSVEITGTTNPLFPLVIAHVFRA
jgi:hypothetical protein